MKDIFTFALTVFTGLIAMMNPIVNIPAFLGIAGHYNKEEKYILVKKATIVAFIILIGFLLLGKFIFSVFDITIPAFKITGGLLIFKIGFDMLQSKPSPVEKTNVVQEKQPFDDSIAVSPLAIPLLSGPGAIVTTMDFVSDTSYIHMLVVVIVVSLVVFINYLALRSGDIIVQKLGHNVIDVLGKLMGLILAIMGTGMIIAGIDLLK